MLLALLLQLFVVINYRSRQGDPCKNKVLRRKTPRVVIWHLLYSQTPQSCHNTDQTLRIMMLFLHILYIRI